LERWDAFDTLLLEGIADVLNVSPVSWVKSSGEHLQLVLEFTDCVIKVNAWALSLDESLIRETSNLNGVGSFNLGGNNGTNQSNKRGIFHVHDSRYQNPDEIITEGMEFYAPDKSYDAETILAKTSEIVNLKSVGMVYAGEALRYWALIESHTIDDICKSGPEVWKFICLEDAKSLQDVFTITRSKNHVPVHSTQVRWINQPQPKPPKDVRTRVSELDRSYGTRHIPTRKSCIGNLYN